MKTPKNQLEYDSKSGLMLPVQEKDEVPQGLKFTRLLTQEPHEFNLVIRIGDDVFFAREASEEAIDDLMDKFTELDTFAQQNQAVFSGRDQAAIKKATDEANRLRKAIRPLVTQFLESVLAGWSLKNDDLPYSTQNLARLSTSNRAQLAREIIKASQTGAEDADFLARLSSPLSKAGA